MITATIATKNVERADREARRQRIADEQARLDRDRVAKENADRAQRLAIERDKRIAETVVSCSTVEFSLNDDTTQYRIRVSLGSKSDAVRATARAAIVALANMSGVLEF